MLQLLNVDEKILLVIRRHWFVLARTVIVFFILILIPPAVLTLLPWITSGVDEALVNNFLNLGLSLYIMVLMFFLFLTWMEYYLDTWIITTARIIDVEQKGLFSRTVSEIPLQNVEDVSVEVSGVIQTFLKFGTLKIQTAGRGEFTIDDAPRLYEAKNIILQYAKGMNKPAEK